MTTSTTDPKVAHAVKDFYAARSAMDEEWLLSFLAPGSTWHDRQSPPAEPPWHPALDAREHLRSLNRSAVAGLESLEVTPVDCLIAGHRAGVRARGRSVLLNGHVLERQLLTVFEFDETGLVTAMWHFDDPDLGAASAALSQVEEA